MAIACFGAAHFDRKALAQGPVTLGDSNIVRMEHGHGGVARNVAENLARLGCDVALVTAVGGDRGGEAVLEALSACGVDVSRAQRFDDEVTASYTALIDARGELVLALADMEIYDRLTPDLVAPMLADLSDRAVWFVDANLPEATLRRIADAKPADTLLCADAVSTAKARRLAPILDRLDMLFANRDEASALAGIPVRAPLDILAAGDRLLTRGVKAAIVTRGGEGLFVAAADEFAFHEALPARVRDVTGAGDALIAGLIYGRWRGAALAEAIGFGLAAATLTIEAATSVRADLSPERLAARAASLRLMPDGTQ